MPLLHPEAPHPQQQAAVLVAAMRVTLAGLASRHARTGRVMAAICSSRANQIHSCHCVRHLYRTGTLRRSRGEIYTSSDGPQ